MRGLIRKKKIVDIEYCFLKCKASFKVCLENSNEDEEIEVSINELKL